MVRKRGSVFRVTKKGDGEYHIGGVGTALAFPEFPDYAVTKCGRVFRVENPHTSSPVGFEKRTALDGKGYPHTVFFDRDRRANRKIHSVVARTWIGQPPYGYVINHIDGNRKNPHADNLEYVSQRQNLRHGRGHVDYRDHAEGGDYTKGRAKTLTDDEICDMRDSGASLQEIERVSGVPMQHIMPILKAGGAYPWS